MRKLLWIQKRIVAAATIWGNTVCTVPCFIANNKSKQDFYHNPLFVPLFSLSTGLLLSQSGNPRSLKQLWNKMTKILYVKPTYNRSTEIETDVLGFSFYYSELMHFLDLPIFSYPLSLNLFHFFVCIELISLWSWN